MSTSLISVWTHLNSSNFKVTHVLKFQSFNFFTLFFQILNTCFYIDYSINTLNKFNMELFAKWCNIIISIWNYIGEYILYFVFFLKGCCSYWPELCIMHWVGIWTWPVPGMLDSIGGVCPLKHVCSIHQEQRLNTQAAIASSVLVSLVPQPGSFIPLCVLYFIDDTELSLCVSLFRKK